MSSGATNDAPVMIGRLCILPYVDLISPKAQRAIVDALPWTKIHVIRDMVDIMTNTSMEIFEATKRSVMGNGGLGRKDIMSVLGTFLDVDRLVLSELKAGLDRILVAVKANNAASEEDKIPQSELVAQISYVLSHSICQLSAHVYHDIAPLVFHRTLTNVKVSSRLV